MINTKPVTHLVQAVNMHDLLVYRKISEEYLSKSLEKNLMEINEASRILSSDEKKNERNIEYLTGVLNQNLAEYKKTISDAKKLQINVKNKEDEFKDITKRNKKAFE